MQIRAINPDDQAEWIRMRSVLWPDEIDDLPQDAIDFFGAGTPYLTAVFVLERSSGGLGGFLELNLRNYAEGCTDSPVPHIEGWYVDADLRGQGYGKRLVQAAEQWALDNGFYEITSDVLIDNQDSIAAHTALGFEEVERIICYVKALSHS